MFQFTDYLDGQEDLTAVFQNTIAQLEAKGYEIIGAKTSSMGIHILIKNPPSMVDSGNEVFIDYEDHTVFGLNKFLDNWYRPKQCNFQSIADLSIEAPTGPQARHQIARLQSLKRKSVNAQAEMAERFLRTSQVYDDVINNCPPHLRLR